VKKNVLQPHQVFRREGEDDRKIVDDLLVDLIQRAGAFGLRKELAKAGPSVIAGSLDPGIAAISL
jgi:hypothetical protein